MRQGVDSVIQQPIAWNCAGRPVMVSSSADSLDDPAALECAYIGGVGV